MNGSKAVQYPQQMGDYAVKVKNGAGWQGQKVARLHISVGQAYHEDKKFQATLDWVDQRFDRVIICVNDTLQRFNWESNGATPETAFNSAETAGTQWIERNSEMIHGLQNSTDTAIQRWEDWKSHPDFKATMGQVRNKYALEAEFKKALDADVSMLWERKNGKPTLVKAYEFERFKSFSTEYLLEETAVFFLMFDEETAVNIYPGSTLLPHHFHDNSGGFTRIDFKNNQRSCALS